MKNRRTMFLLLCTPLISAPVPGFSQAESENASRGSMVQAAITDMAAQDNNELPQLMKDDVKIKQGKTMYTVTQRIPARGQAAGLQCTIWSFGGSQRKKAPCSASKSGQKNRTPKLRHLTTAGFPVFKTTTKTNKSWTPPICPTRRDL
jgi:hypothetical protein